MSSKLRKQSDEASVFIRVTTRAWPKPTNRYIHTLHIPIPIGSKLELSILEVIHFAEDQSPTKHKNVYSDEILRPRSMKPIHFTRGPPNWGGLSWISKSLTRSIPSQKATIGECQVSYHLKGPQDWDPKGDNSGGAITWDSCNHRVLADSRDVPKQIHNAEEILPLRRRRHNHEPERDVRALRTQMTTQFRSQVWSRLFRRRCVSLNANRVQVSLELAAECSCWSQSRSWSSRACFLRFEDQIACQSCYGEDCVREEAKGRRERLQFAVGWRERNGEVSKTQSFSNASWRGRNKFLVP